MQLGALDTCPFLAGLLGMFLALSIKPAPKMSRPAVIWPFVQPRLPAVDGLTV